VEWLELTGLTAFRHARVGEFSRGMRQRLTVARAFLHDPEVLLLDEPWTALDDRAMALLSDLLLRANQRGRTIVVCSHQLRETLEVATELAVLDRGRLIYRGPNREDFKSSPHDFYQRIS
jgi:ABC-type multidrug transport system ATPase subunit